MSLKILSFSVLVLAAVVQANVIRENDDASTDVELNELLKRVETAINDKKVQKDVRLLTSDWKVYIEEMFKLEFPEQVYDKLKEIFAKNWAQADQRTRNLESEPMDRAVRTEATQKKDRSYTKEENVNFLVGNIHRLIMDTWGFNFPEKVYKQLFDLFADNWDEAYIKKYRLVDNLVRDLNGFMDTQWHGVKFSRAVYNQIFHLFMSNYDAAKGAIP